MRRNLLPLWALLAGWAAPAAALTFDVNGQPLTLNLTETADVAFHLDNGSIAPAGTPNYDPTSDNYFDWINKFDAQLSWGRWHAEARFDSALFVNAPQVTGTIPPLSQCLSGGFTGACENRNLSQLLENRYTDNFIAEKLSINYLGDHVDATLGDFYLSYGRGLVISLQKVDALGVDTTLRGGNFNLHLGRFTASAAAGFTNMVNTDEATGEVAPDPNDRVVAARFEYRQPRLFTLGVDGAGFFQNPDTALLQRYGPGAPSQQVPISVLGFGGVSTQPITPGASPQSLLSTGNFSGTLDLPHLWSFGKLYLEYAHQVQATYSAGQRQTNNGDAFFGSLDVFLGPATLLIEGKDYQHFQFPIGNSLSSVMFPAFWQQNVYSNPPNLEEIFQEEQSTEDIYGPRARLDVQIGEHFTPFVSAAFFEDDSNQYDIWDGYLGLDANWQEHRSHGSVSIGRRLEIDNQLSSQVGVPNQQEWWVQYDVVQVLGPVYSLELEGLHRRFDIDVLSGHPWSWGYAYLSLKRSAWTATLGYEYNTQEVTTWRPYNPNAGFAWNISDHYTVRAFAGGREAGLRCINGLCRNFPGFTGASAELVARY